MHPDIGPSHANPLNFGNLMIQSIHNILMKFFFFLDLPSTF